MSITRPIQDDDTRSFSSDFTIDLAQKPNLGGFGFPLQRMLRFDGPLKYAEDEYDEEEDAESSSGSERSGWEHAFAGDALDFQTPKAKPQLFLGNTFTSVLSDDSEDEEGQSLNIERVEPTSTQKSLAIYLNSDSLRNDPWNHTIPTEVVQNGRDSFLVKRILRDWRDPPPRSVRDCLDFTRQLLEGLVFLHENRVSRIPFSPTNISMDTGLAPASGSDTEWDRSDYPVRYYITNLGDAARFEWTLSGWKEGNGDGEGELDVFPFVQDVFALGDMFRTLFEEIPDSPLQPLTNYMTAPETHPTAEASLAFFEGLWNAMEPSDMDAEIGEIGGAGSRIEGGV